MNDPVIPYIHLLQGDGHDKSFDSASDEQAWAVFPSLFFDKYAYVMNVRHLRIYAILRTQQARQANNPTVAAYYMQHAIYLTS